MYVHLTKLLHLYTYSAVATILIQNGTMKRGKYLVAGETWAKVKVMLNEHKARKNTFSLSQPVVTVGWKEVPEVGEEVLEVEDEVGSVVLRVKTLKKAAVFIRLYAVSRSFSAKSKRGC